MKAISSWFVRHPEEPSLWRDLKSGDAGWLPRIGLSLAAAGFVFAITFLIIGLLDHLFRLSDSYMAVCIGIGGAAWCVSLMFIWATFPRWWKALKTFFCILGIWLVAIPAAVFVEDVMSSEEFFISSILALVTGATVFMLFTLGYRRGGGRTLALRDGVIDVRCPECGYSMVGLSQCMCPECGSTLTIDELIRKQNYRTTMPRREALPAAASIEADIPSQPAMTQQELESHQPILGQTASE